jgi:hypothetical protein
MAFERNLEERKKFFEQNKWKLDQALANSLPQPKAEPVVEQPADEVEEEETAVEQPVFLVDVVEEAPAEEEAVDVEIEEEFSIDEPDFDGLADVDGEIEGEIEEEATEEAPEIEMGDVDVEFEAEAEAEVEAEESDFNFDAEEEAPADAEVELEDTDFNFDADDEEINLDDLDLDL